MNKYISHEDISPFHKRKVIGIISYSLLTYLIFFSSIYIYKQNNSFLIISMLLLLVTQRHLQTHVHDICHFFFTRNRKVNDLIGDYFFAGFIGMKIDNYRKIHQNHHKYNGSKDDPEYFSRNDVMKYGGYLNLCLSYAFGLEAIKLIKKYYFSKNKNSSNIFKKFHNLFHICLCQILLVYVLYMSNVVFFYPIWIYFALSFSPLLSRLRFLVEHPGSDNTTRTTTSFFIEKIFFAPHSFNYHFEHHAWPMIPPYNLKKVHKKLKEKKFYDNHPENFNDYFLSSLK